jgi:hypothetical protein
MSAPRKASSAARPAKPAKGKAGRSPAGNGHKVHKGNGSPRAARAVKGAGRAADVVKADPSLFAPLTPGEIADALRTLTEDRRVSGMAKVGRYRVIATEPLVIKPPHWMAGHRLARVVIYDYAADRCVDATVDLDAGVVAHLDISRSQPMLSREEEAMAVSISMSDERVRSRVSLGEEPQVAMHYWGKDPGDLSYGRRSAAVIFGRTGGHPTVVAVVDLLDNVVSTVTPAGQW